jgi:hypothetical protein
MNMNVHPQPLMVWLIRSNLIPGVTTRDALAAAMQGQPVQVPATFCADCAHQLVQHWYAANPVTELRLLCLMCARPAVANGDEVHLLIGEEGWL